MKTLRLAPVALLAACAVNRPVGVAKVPAAPPAQAQVQLQARPPAQPPVQAAVQPKPPVQPSGPKPHEIGEASTALLGLAVVTPENLFVGSTPSAVDGKNLVYTARQWVDGALPNTASIWRTPVTGGAATRLVAAGDGEWLLMARSAPRAANVYFAVGGTIYGTAKNGIGGRRRYPGSGYRDYAPVPSPDDRRLLFGSCTAGRDCYFQDTNYIWIMNADGSETTQLRQGRDAQFSPDGERIVFSYKGDIWTMRPDGGEATNLTPSEEFVDTQPTFSPEGKVVYFTRVQAKAAAKQTDIWMMKDDGTEVVQLTTNPAEDVAPFAGPDGYVLFLSNRGPLVGAQYPSRIWRARVAPPAAAPAPAPVLAPGIDAASPPAPPPAPVVEAPPSPATPAAGDGPPAP